MFHCSLNLRAISLRRRMILLTAVMALLCGLSPARAAVIRAKMLDKGPFSAGQEFRVEVGIEDNATSLSTFALAVVYTTSTLTLVTPSGSPDFNRQAFGMIDRSKKELSAGAGKVSVRIAGVAQRPVAPQVRLFTLRFKVKKAEGEASIFLQNAMPNHPPLFDFNLQPRPNPISTTFDCKETQSIALKK